MSSRLGRALRGLSFVCVWLAALPALAQIRNEGAIPDGRGGVNALTIGAHHTCGIRQDGTAMCWGDNWYGEARPLPGTFIELSAGFGHTCGLRGDGGVACWGAGYTPVPSEPEPPMPPPSPVPAGRFTTISSAMSTTCGLRARSVPWEYPEGNVACWSASGWQLPAPPQGDFVALSVGNEFACALRANGKPVCWGYINPEQVPAEDTFIAISAGAHHACGLRADGSVRCWGDNWAGQATPPADLFTAISAGSFNTCGLRPDGTALCWGENGSGQSSPPSPERFTAITGGESHACGLRSDGHVTCWGNVNWNFYPDPPPPYTMPPLLPQDTVFGMGQLAAGDWHDCQINAQGELACWGGFAQEPEPTVRFGALSSGWEATCARDEQGQMRCYGANEMMRIDLPFEPLRQFDLGYEHGCGVAALDGSPKCWGRETDGKTLPPMEPLGQLFRNTSAGLMHSCGVTAHGMGQCWGYNGDGETSVPTLSPERGYLHVDAGERHSCGLDSALNILCWGMSPQPSEPGYYDPDVPPEFPSFRALSAGGYHSCAIRTDGRLLCWGANWGGQLQAPEGTFVAVSAGHSHTCAIRTDGSRACWGEPWLTPRLVLDPDRVRELRPGEWAHIPFQLRSESPYQLREPRYAIVAGTLPMGFWFDPEGVLRGSSNEPGRYPLTVEGRDRNGFAARRDYTLVIDGTPPVIEPQITGTLGDNGWYTSPIDVQWAVTDPESDVLHRYGCELVSLAYETSGAGFLCHAESAGGWAMNEVHARVDLYPPYAVLRAFHSNGAQATFEFDGQDPMSGVAGFECSLDGGDFTACASPLTSTYGSGPHEMQIRAVDVAGHRSEPVRQSWVADGTAPQITANVTGHSVFPDWYISDVRIEWSVADPDTGIVATTGCEVTTLSTDSPQASFTCTATNGAGETSSSTVNVKRDATLPVIDLQEYPRSATNQSDAHFRFALSDNLSGHRHAACQLDNGQKSDCNSGEFHASGLAPGTHRLRIEAWDMAGNRRETSYQWAIDITAPTVDPVVTGPRNSAGWYLAPVTIDFYISEPDSPITEMTGCGRTILANDSPGASFTCTAGSAGGATVKTVSVKLDSTQPDTRITSAPSDPYNPTSTRFEFTGTDATSGVTEFFCNLDGDGFRSCTSPLTVNVGAGSHVLEVMARDAAGWVDEETPARHAWMVDGTPPTITPTITGTKNASDWYSSDVQISWETIDPESGIVSSAGCNPITLDADTTTASFTCTASSAGGTRSETVWVRRDATPPDTTLTAVPPVVDGQVRGEFQFTGQDALVGVRYYECSVDHSAWFVCGSPHQYQDDAGQHTFRVRAVDHADNRDPTPAEYSWVIDTTAPVITPAISGAKGNDGWYVGDVHVSWSVTDAESAISTAPCTSVVVDTDTAGSSFTCTATSAGGTSARTVTVKRDATAPIIDAGPTAAANAAGWYKDDVAVEFRCSDAMSGDVVCPATQVLTGEGAAVASTARIVTDAAGNSAVSRVVTVRIDRTRPTLAPTVMPGTLLLNAAAAANANGSDGLSGIAGQQCAPVATGTPGTRSATCTVVDAAGNTASAAATYRVVYGFNGFSAPVQNPSVLNVIKAGRSIPLRWRVVDAQGAPVDTLTAAAVRAVPIACPNATENRIASYGSGNGQLQNLGNGYYQLDWAAANSLRGACRSLDLDLGDGELHSALFKFN